MAKMGSRKISSWALRTVRDMGAHKLRPEFHQNANTTMEKKVLTSGGTSTKSRGTFRKETVVKKRAGKKPKFGDKKIKTR